MQSWNKKEDKPCKWKAFWVKSSIATKSLQPPMWITSFFKEKILSPLSPSMNFQTFQSLTLIAPAFWKRKNENVIHLFSICHKVYSVWTEITHHFSESVYLIHRLIFLGYLGKSDKDFFIRNLVLVVFKFYDYNSRVTGRLNLNSASVSQRKHYRKRCFSKWLTKMKSFPKEMLIDRR